MSGIPATAKATADLLSHHGYIPDEALATSVFLALKLERPLLLEGEAGVGKTELARVLAAALARPLVRLQCYEGLDLASAAYEWNVSRQLVHIRAAEAAGEGRSAGAIERDIYTADYLLRRPLLQALELSAEGRPPVLLIDELDRADEPFEAFLLELLSDFQVTIPELGTIKATVPPVVIVTSNRTREIHDALRRRCLYHWVDFPDAARERAILARKAPLLSEHLSAEIVAFVQRLRQEDLFKLPGVAETLDWAAALSALDAQALEPALVDDTLGALLKYQDDLAKIRGAEAARLVAGARA
jgi:MoxR-like ATPase